MCFALLLLVSCLVCHGLRATAVEGLSCLIELWLPWVVERSNFILHGEFCKMRYVTQEGGNLALKVCVKELGVELTGALKGVYGNLWLCFPRKCSWSWVPSLGLLENPSPTAKCHSLLWCLSPCLLSASWPEIALARSHALPQTSTKDLSESLFREPSTSQGTDTNCILLGRAGQGISNGSGKTQIDAAPAFLVFGFQTA